MPSGAPLGSGTIHRYALRSGEDLSAPTAPVPATAPDLLAPGVVAADGVAARKVLLHFWTSGAPDMPSFVTLPDHSLGPARRTPALPRLLPQAARRGHGTVVQEPVRPCVLCGQPALVELDGFPQRLSAEHAGEAEAAQAALIKSAIPDVRALLKTSRVGGR
ncbi:hypothetical protein [Streptomyces globisporus]|uniref:hypothetical protein n=1 Tax=Streptomyces globisporus TaxID=1908 RepID=UPI0004C5D954|nr:hypothetical protein [Streptomyces globisporus]